MKLPSLTFKEWQALVRAFGSNLRGLGSPVVVGKNRRGLPFTIHYHPGRRLDRREVSVILKRLAVTPEEFAEWYYGKRRCGRR
ncbi:MAG: hypothetical protein HPY89_00605 [Pelotomaculum sp.]|nr:hypothetical protein [Pelotomaculum sp.]